MRGGQKIFLWDNEQAKEMKQDRIVQRVLEGEVKRAHEREGKKERLDIWSYCSHSENQVSTHTPPHIHTPDTIGDINILWAI